MKIMNKVILFIMIIMLFPIVVKADNQEEILVSSVVKYYKTVVNKDNNISYLTNSLSQGNYTVEVSEEEYYSSNISSHNSIMGSVASETNYKRVVTNIYSVGSQYKYEVELTWRQMPSKRSYDIIGIAHYGSVTIDGNPTFSQTYCTSTNCTTSSSFTRVNSNNGISAVFKLPTSTSIITLSQKLSFKVKKNTTSTIIEQIAVGDYAHGGTCLPQINYNANNISSFRYLNKVSFYMIVTYKICCCRPICTEYYQ